MTKTVTAHDVARAAGVSQITVSRTFSGKAPVAEATRQRILHVAERMGYRPNILAAGLRGGQTTSVGALWSFGMAGDDARIGLEILWSAQERGYATYQAEHPDTVEQTCRILRDWHGRRIDAVVIRWKPTMLDDPRICQALAAFPWAVAVVPRPIADFPRDQLIHDRRPAIAEVARHFARTGRRRPAFMMARGEHNRAKEQAFTDAWYAAGGTDHEHLLIDTGLVTERVSEHCRRVLERTFTDRVTIDAIFCNADEAAMAATRFLQQRGLRVPDDVAVVGFNDTEAAAMWDPPLASVDRRHDEVARCVEQMLFSWLEGSARPPQSTAVPMTFVHRRSAG